MRQQTQFKQDLCTLLFKYKIDSYCSETLDSLASDIVCLLRDKAIVNIHNPSSKNLK